MSSAITKRIRLAALPVLGAIALLSSCNKDLEVPALPATTPVAGSSLAELLAATPDDSLFYRLVVRGGMVNALNNKANTFTVFVPNNAGMKLFVNTASGGAVPLAAPDATFSAFIANTLTAATAASIVNYNMVPQKFFSSNIPTVTSRVSNIQLPTGIILDPTNPLVRMTTFPSKNGGNAYVNTIPIVPPIDVTAANGVIHHTFTLVTPPSALLKNLVAAESNLSYLRAAIVRADSGQVGLSRFDSAMNFGVANLTIFAPTDAAFQALLIPLITQALINLGQPPATALANATALASTPAVFSNPALFAALSATTVRGILAYHILGYRLFNCNMLIPSGGGFYQTLLNGSIAAHPGLQLQASFSGPFAAAFTATGLGTLPGGGIPYSGPAANGIKRDVHGVNGVLHVIDRVLLPQ